MSRAALDEMVMRCKGKFDARQLSRLAPFLSSEALEKLIVNNENEINWDTLRRLAPFLKREVVDALTMAVAKGEKYLRPTAQAVKKSTKDIGRAISQGLDKAFRHLNDLGDQIEKGIKASAKDACTEKTTHTVSETRTRIFQRALDESKFDWIAEHMDQLQDDELKSRIVLRARELGMNDWISENMGDYFDQETMDGAILSGNWEYIAEHLDSVDSDTRDMIISTAISEGRWDWLRDNIDELELSDDNVEKIINSALSDDKWDWLMECMDELSLDDRADEIAIKAYAAGRRDIALELVDEYSDSCDMYDLLTQVMNADDNEFVDEIMEHIDTETANSFCITLARSGRLGEAACIAEYADEECLAALLDIATEAGDWDVINKINDLI